MRNFKMRTSLGKALYVIRKFHHFNRLDVEKHTGICMFDLSLLENGNMEISSDRLKLLADMYKTTPETLKYFDEEISPKEKRISKRFKRFFINFWLKFVENRISQ